VRVAVGGLHFNDAFSHLQDGYVEGAAAEVVHRDGLVFLLVEAISKGCGRRLVDDTQHIQAGNLARIFRRLPLCVVEIGRNGDDRVGDLLAQVVLGSLFQLLKNDRRDFRGRVLLAARFNPAVSVGRAGDLVWDARSLAGDLVVLTPHEPLDGKNGVFWIRDGLTLGNLSHEPFAVLGDGYDGRRQPRAFLIDDNRRFPALHDRDDRVGGAKVDPDDFACHVLLSPNWFEMGAV
jgi:hypothetical protein